MSRAFRLTSGALVVICALAGAAAAKPSIAILGLEVIDKSGTPSNDDVQFAKNLTEGLRGRAKIGGPYVLAPTGDKELIDLKLLKGCDDEKPTCMSSIGGDLNADFLIYGSVTKKKQGNYDISVAFLDVHAGKRERTIPTSIPVGTSGIALQNAAKKIYNGLTGQSDSCTITIKTPGVDRGTILINSKEAGNITNGVGSVNGLSEGKYAIAIESTGFHRYTKGDVQCTGGETTNIQATLDKADKVVVPPANTVTPSETNPTDGNHEISGSVSHPAKNNWKYVAIGSGVLTVGVGIPALVYSVKLVGLGTDHPNNSFFNPGSNCISDPQTGAITGVKNGASIDDCKAAKSDSWSTKSYLYGGATVVLGAFTAFAIYKAIKHDDSSDEHMVSNGHRKRHEAFAITPVVSATGGGATFRMEW
jgi:hypothetical protein